MYKLTQINILRYLCFFVVLIILSPTASAASKTLAGLRNEYDFNIKSGEISVSGVSAGGWMANQFHIAHSQNVVGAGIIAAGPYHCAGSPSFSCHNSHYAIWWPYDACVAMHVCSRTMAVAAPFWGLYWGPPDATDSVTTTTDEAAAGTIDPISGLKGDRVWLFSGPKDELVPTAVVDELEKYYATLFRHPQVGNSVDNLKFVTNDPPAAHAMLVSVPPKETDSTKLEKECGFFGLPFINDCDYSAAGQLLDFIYGNLTSVTHGQFKEASIHKFDQTPFFDINDESVSMHANGHVYIPEACRGVPCRLHVAFHGCEQDEDTIRQKCAEAGVCAPRYFFRDGGYNAWAEKNGIIVLYPQNTPWGSTGDNTTNPLGCWDWWGYSGTNYFRKSGKQIQAVARMINELVGQPLLSVQGGP